MGRLHRLKHIKGYSLDAADGEIGKVEEVYFDDQRWTVRYFVVHTGSWLLGREVLIPPRAVARVNPKTARVTVELTRDKIRNSPPVESKRPVSRHYEEAFLRYYEWERYWIIDALSGTSKPRAGERSPIDRLPEHPYLRSSNKVCGYNIHALDGDIGHVEDFILDDPSWKVGYLEVDTSNWRFGRHVLVAPTWVTEINWSKRRVSVNLERALIRTAPAYDPSRLITSDYEERLYRHYGKERS